MKFDLPWIKSCVDAVNWASNVFRWSESAKFGVLVKLAFLNSKPCGIKPVKKYFFLNDTHCVDLSKFSVSTEVGLSVKLSNSSSSVKR